MPTPAHSAFHGALAATLAVSAALSACAIGPDYRRPDVAMRADHFKEAGADWHPAAPGDAIDRGAWWELFGDAQLDEMAKQVEVSNQNIAAAQAAYAQARAMVREQRAALFPVVDLSGGVTRSGSKSSNTGVVTGGTVSQGGGVRNRYQSSIGASWEPDVWGRLRRSVENARASAEASAADLAAARLAAQGELVTNYLSLREADAEIALQQATVDGYQRSLTIAQNRYAAGVAPRTDVLSAQTQLYNAQATLEGLRQTRATLEHAIAVLVGKAPADFSLAPAEWNGVVPEVPLLLPSVLLQRRPDIAAAERKVAAANASVGIAQAAWFPSFPLSGSYGSSASHIKDLFDSSTMLWSLGVSASETLLDFGARKAQVAQARAAYDAAVANYRQLTLSAFQDVEDQLTATRVLETQYALRRQASEVADENERQILNQYKAGQITFSDVVTAQASAASARSALIQAALDRQTTAVALIQALGGGWHAAADED
ncbi:efflux transporter outer membrane subunit [Solimonas soli]|uniref:efflux transporter outer membrane subunit n=1 Tax=Solimonas soli TaxID=413479 RepID=UPI0005B9DD4F|nr:efflux transporter outer membrane subunit [Solimonas soli]